MKIDYYCELMMQCKRIREILSADAKDRARLKEESDKWRRFMSDKLGDDFLPPIDRRDLMAMIQNLGYISYEVWRLPELRFFDAAEGLLMKNELENCLETLSEELGALKAKRVCITKLRQAAYRLLSVWHSSYAAGCDSMLCDGYEATGDAILRLADSMEMALAVN